MRKWPKIPEKESIKEPEVSTAEQWKKAGEKYQEEKTWKETSEDLEKKYPGQNVPQKIYDEVSKICNNLLKQLKLKTKIPSKRKLPGDPNRSGMWLNYRLLASPAFWELTATAIRVYTIFHLKCQKVGIKESKKTGEKKGTIKNNGKITFTYSDAKKYKIGTVKTFTNAINQLIDLGFIDINVLGGVSR